MTAPVGAIVRLYVDLRARVHYLDVIETGTGRRYLVLEVRVQQRGKRRGRQHLRCMVIDHTTAVDRSSTVHRIVWYPR